MASDNTLPSLSPDVIFEILSRTCLKTVAKCRLLCKNCNSLTYESTFLSLHCQRTKHISGYFLQTMRHNKCYYTYASIDDNCVSDLSLNFLPAPVKIEASTTTTQGLLLCVEQVTRRPRFYVCKPVTKEWHVIPSPKTRYLTLGTGMLVLRSSPLQYKIVRLSQPRSYNKKYYNLRAEIFDSGINAWKQLEDVRLQCHEFLNDMPPVSACGSTHWLTKRNNVLAFHANTDNFSVFSLPSAVYVEGHYDHIHLTGYEGKLALICERESENLLNLWVMHSYEGKAWSMRQTIRIESLRRQEPSVNPLAFYNSDIALMDAFNGIIFFKIKNGSSDTVRLDYKMNQPHEVFPFRSDFKPNNLKTSEFVQPRSSKSKLRGYADQYIS